MWCSIFSRHSILRLNSTALQMTDFPKFLVPEYFLYQWWTLLTKKQQNQSTILSTTTLPVTCWKGFLWEWCQDQRSDYTTTVQCVFLFIYTQFSQNLVFDFGTKNIWNFYCFNCFISANHSNSNQLMIYTKYIHVILITQTHVYPLMI